MLFVECLFYHLIRVDSAGHYDDEARLLDKEQELDDLKEKEPEVSKIQTKETKGHNNQQVTKAVGRECPLWLITGNQRKKLLNNQQVTTETTWIYWYWYKHAQTPNQNEHL